MLTISLGQVGEKVAGKFLVTQGFRLQATNYRCPIGEVDIIALHRGILYFIEVKTRTTTAYGWPAEAVTPTKQAKLRQIALYYLMMNKHEGVVAFGVVEVLYHEKRRCYQVNFIPHAF
ncbi:MAG: YraN family protein [Patescibacteria group bacterium]